MPRESPQYPECNPSKGITPTLRVSSQQRDHPSIQSVIPARESPQYPRVSSLEGNHPNQGITPTPRVSSQDPAELSNPQQPGRRRVRGWGQETLCPKSLGWGSLQPLQSPLGVLGWPQAPCPSGHPRVIPSSPAPTPKLPIPGCSRAPQHKPGPVPPHSGVPSQGHLHRAASPERELGIICVERDIYKKKNKTKTEE